MPKKLIESQHEPPAERRHWRARRDASLAEEAAKRKASLFPDFAPRSARTMAAPSLPLNGFWRQLYSKFRTKHVALFSIGAVPAGPFITEDELVAIYRAQGGRCELSGREFGAGTRTSSHFTLPGVPSLDRLDQRRGYIIGNVRLVVFEANRARGDGTDEELIMLCRDIIARSKKRPRPKPKR